MSKVREQIIEVLKRCGSMTCAQMGRVLGTRPQNLRFHLRVLEDAEAVKQTGSGQHIIWHLSHADVGVPEKAKRERNVCSSQRVLDLLNDGPMTKREIRQVLGLTDSETKNVLHHMHLNGSVQCLDKSGARPLWALPGHDCVKVYLADQRKSPIGRYLTGAPV